MRTKDFQAFSEPGPFLDPGFEGIDSRVVPAGRCRLIVFNDERRDLMRKKPAARPGCQSPRPLARRACVAHEVLD